MGMFTESVEDALAERDKQHKLALDKQRTEMMGLIMYQLQQLESSIAGGNKGPHLLGQIRRMKRAWNR